MVKEAILKLKIRKANGDFSVFMSRKTKRSDVTSVLEYAAKKANKKQREMVSSSK